MSIPLPTFEQVLELPAQIDRVVPPEYIDLNGHMNIGHYLLLGAEGLWLRCTDLEMGDTYIPERGLSNFTAEHHIRYFAEVLEGERVSTHVRLLDRSDKVLHAIALIVNRSRQQLACTVEVTLVHMDMASRRSTSFPDDIAPLVDAAIKADDLGWPAPVCGSMGARRSS
nr:3-hydroxybutyryl-CoA dehydratase [Aeromicrobium sp.]